MKLKYKFILFFFIFLIVIFVLGATNVENKNSNTFIQLIKSKLPHKLKVVLKETIFSIPTLNRKTARLEIAVNELNSKIAVLSKRVEYLHAGNEQILPKIDSKQIKSQSNNYDIKTFRLPFPTNYDWLMKAVAYLEQTEEEIILASGDGNFFSLKKAELQSEDLNIKKINSNIKDVIKNEEFYSSGPTGIRDLLIIDNKILFSFTKKLKDGCYNTSIMNSELNPEYLNFSEFFTYEECVDENSPKYMSGGRMVSFREGKILLTIGTWGHKRIAQDKNSLFGKVISIDIKSKKYEIIAMGSRNAQGLYYDKISNVIVHTEHGPKGGDEININLNPDNKIVENYGWPISSYGEYDDEKFKKEAPLHKSHKDYGFVEPIKYYTPSIAISEIIKIPETLNEKFTNDFFVAALGRKAQINEGDRSIHHVRFNKNFDQIIFEDIVPIGERIRDMIFVRKKNIILMVLESIPAIGILKLVD